MCESLSIALMCVALMGVALICVALMCGSQVWTAHVCVCRASPTVCPQLGLPEPHWPGRPDTLRAAMQCTKMTTAIIAWPPSAPQGSQPTTGAKPY